MVYLAASPDGASAVSVADKITRQMLIADPRIRASVFSRNTESGQPPRRVCPACAEEILPDRWR
jgi:hypothetical protein